MTRVDISPNVWYDPGVKNYFMLDVTAAIETPTEIDIDGVVLFPKDEYHCSLVPAGKIAEGQRLQGLNYFLVTYLRANPDLLRFDGLGDERYICKKNDEVTLVAPARVVGIEALRAAVRQMIPEYEPAFPHVTLLKSENSPYGIGINSEKDLAEYCTRIDI